MAIPVSGKHLCLPSTFRSRSRAVLKANCASSSHSVAAARPSASQGAPALRSVAPVDFSRDGFSFWHAPRRAVAVMATAEEDTAHHDDDIMELEIKVGGMMCDGCTSRVAEALQKAAGVRKVEVSLEKALATCEVKAPGGPLVAFNMLPALVETVRELGFEAEPYIDGLE